MNAFPFKLAKEKKIPNTCDEETLFRRMKHQILPKTTIYANPYSRRNVGETLAIKKQNKKTPK